MKNLLLSHFLAGKVNKKMGQQSMIKRLLMTGVLHKALSQKKGRR